MDGLQGFNGIINEQTLRTAGTADLIVIINDCDNPVCILFIPLLTLFVRIHCCRGSCDRDCTKGAKTYLRLNRDLQGVMAGDREKRGVI